MEKIIWITGASSGIGEALAYQWSEQDAVLILSARRTAELERVKQACARPEKCRLIPLDLEDPLSLEAAADEVLKSFGRVDIFVNNGGISQRSLVVETPIEIDRKIMEVDYFGGVYLSKRVLPSMIANGGGHFVVLSSIVGIFGFPQRSAYSAAKHALHGFYESLWAENRASDIGITLVCPGRIRTNISYHAVNAKGEGHGVMDPAQDKGIDPNVCAKKIIRAVEKKKKEIYICEKEIFMVFFRKCIPSLYFRLVSRIKPNG